MTQSTPITRPADTRTRLHQAAVRLVARDGAGASVRSIAREAGVSEGALYRHYHSREDLLAAVFVELVAPMIEHKQRLVDNDMPARACISEWVRRTYESFDQDPDGFAYVFLTDHAMPAEHLGVAGKQRGLLRAFFQRAQQAGEIQEIPLELAESLFVGILLCVPGDIRRGKLPAPASRYTEGVTESIWGALSAGSPPAATRMGAGGDA